MRRQRPLLGQSTLLLCPTDLHANLPGRKGAVAAVLQALAHLCSSECDAPGAAYRALLLTLLTLQVCLSVLGASRAFLRLSTQSLLACDETRATFVAEKGPDVLVQRVLRTRYADGDVASRCARALTAAATQHENAKVSLFRAGAADALLDALKAHTSNAGVAADVCTALTAIATPDDRRVAASSAFAHGRHLYSQDAHAPLMEIVRKHSDSDRTVAAACYALRAVAVNDEACERMVDAGVVEAGVRLLVRQLEVGKAPCVFLRPALVMFRQLAGSDVAKSRFISASGLEPLVGILVASCAPPWVSTCEQALALCAALSLRNPDFVASAATAGILDAALDAMTAHPQSAGVQRAAAMFIRNCAARNADVRPMLLDRGAEPLLRAAKKSHPSACADVGSAALRDLGADNYNEGWTPTTVYMGAEGQLYTYDDLGHDDTD